MQIRAKTEEERKIAHSIQENLLTFPLAKDTHTVRVVEHDGKIAISYITANPHIRDGTTHFDLEIRGNICDILSIEIEEKHRSRGYGKKLYQTIEEFAKKQGYKRMQTSPSGMGNNFWRRVGFDMPCEMGLEKSI